MFKVHSTEGDWIMSAPLEVIAKHFGLTQRDQVLIRNGNSTLPELGIVVSEPTVHDEHKEAVDLAFTYAEDGALLTAAQMFQHIAVTYFNRAVETHPELSDRLKVWKPVIVNHVLQYHSPNHTRKVIFNRSSATFEVDKKLFLTMLEALVYVEMKS